MVSDLVAAMHDTHQLSIAVPKSFNDGLLNALGMTWQDGFSNTVVVLIEDEPKGWLLHQSFLHPFTIAVGATAPLPPRAWLATGCPPEP